MIVNWTPGSLNDLESIERYISEDNPAAAQRVVTTILGFGSALSEMPRRGREGSVPGTHELVLLKFPYTIAYRITDEGVDMLRVLHHARLWPDMM